MSRSKMGIEVHGKNKMGIKLETSTLAFQTLGVVYGDIGTSPLYIFSSITISDAQLGDILGVVSLIFWTLTLIGVTKYTLVLHEDDNGEGNSTVNDCSH